MAASRPNTVNLALLAVTILSLMLAAYSLLLTPAGPNPRANTPNDRDLSAQDLPTRSNTSHESAGSKRPITDRETGSSDRDNGSASGSRRDEAAPDGRAPAIKDPAAKNEQAVAPESSDTSGSISGIVIDGSGQAVEGARVVARPADQRDQPRNHPDFETELSELELHIQRLRAQQRSVASGLDGRFTISGLNSAISYDLSASAVSGGTARLSRVGCGDNVTLLLSRECLLKGKVSRADGKPLTRFRVHWLRADLPNEPGNERVLSMDGHYEVRVKPGRHTVWISVDGVGESPRQEIDITDVGAEVSFSFSGLAALAGVVSDTRQNPLPEATVRLEPLEDRDNPDETEFDPAVPRSVLARCDSLGRYRFEALAPGRYSVRISLGSRSDSREIALATGETKQDFSLNAGARVTLKFRSPRGDAITDVNVIFERKGRNERPTALPAEEPGVRIFTGLEPGEYSIRYFARGGAWARQNTTLVEGDNLLTLDIAEASFIQGKVTGAGTPEGLLLRLRPEAGKAESNSHYSAVVKTDGTFRAGPALPGNYVLELLAQQRTVVYTMNVKLGVGDTTQDIAVRDLATLALRVSLPDGKPAAGARVTLVNGKNSYSARCDERGSARISYVPAGESKLTAEAGEYRSREHSFTLRSGESDYSLELKAPNCVRISKVDKGGEADKAGLQVGDLVFAYNGQDVTDRNTLNRLIEQSKGQESVTLSVDRASRVIVLSIKGGTFGGAYANAVR